MTDERTDPATDHDDDADLRALLQSSGARPVPPAEMTDEVRAAVAAEWRSVVAARRPQRRVVPWLAAASAAAVAVGAWFALTQPVGPGAVVATVARLDGAAEVRHGSATSWESIAAGADLRAGDRVRTPATGRLALRRTDGLEVRLDVDTAVAFEDDERARLEAGRVYIDSGRTDARTDAFVVETALGAVRHLGTQYAVSVARASMAVAVREGNVAIDHGGGHALASAGESVTLAADGRLERAALAPHDAAWGWAEAAAPAFAIEGRTLDEFLTWAARETGRRLVYASAAAAREAQQTLLRGSVDGLAPEEAIGAVLMTTPALKARVGGAQLRVERALPPAAP
ncbi:MAG TPA: FecR family protein [Steroidobacteraceae bacterium]|nr:FecR family protein [Steroidobacteraceae bacterium]